MYISYSHYNNRRIGLIENLLFQWNNLYWKNADFVAAKFESLVILSMEKPDNYSYSGVDITAIIQFGSTTMSKENYLTAWNSISTDGTELESWKLAENELLGNNFEIFILEFLTYSTLRFTSMNPRYFTRLK